MWRVAYQAVQHSISLTKIFFIFSLICFLPQIFIAGHKKRSLHVALTPQATDFKLAVQVISADYIKNLCAKPKPLIALITNAAARDYAGSASNDILAAHGIAIDASYDLEQSEYQEIATIIDRYCSSHDLVLIDVQDTGSQTMAVVQGIIDGAQRHSACNVILLDRPNLFGPKIEGSLLAISHDTHATKLPLRTGMTIGELMHYYMARLKLSLPIRVVAMHNYDRNLCMSRSAHATGAEQKLYGATLCALLAEVMPLDVGLATEHAHTVIALPHEIEFCKKNWYELQVQLREFAIESSICSYYSPIKKSYCTGLKLHIEDIFAVDSFTTLLTTLTFFKQCGLMLGFTQRFDDLVGSPMVRLYVDGKISRSELTYTINYDLEQFYRQAFNAFMYHPLPQVVLV
jgi:uncharacterized protein YbbC (DUF1343 family)